MKIRARPEDVRTLLRVAGKPRQGLDQGFRGRIAIQKFAGAGTHRSHDGGRMVHFPNRKNSDIRGVRLDQFNGADGPLRAGSIDIDQDDFGPDVLNLAQHRVRGAGRETHVTEDIAAHSGSFQTMLEHRQPFPVFSQKSYSYTLHGFTLLLASVCY